MIPDAENVHSWITAKEQASSSVAFFCPKNKVQTDFIKNLSVCIPI